MQCIEFEVTVEDGVIKIPEAYQNDIVDAETVKVVVVKKRRRNESLILVF